MFNGAAYGLTLCVLGLTFAVARLTGPLDPYPGTYYQSRLAPDRADMQPDVRRAAFFDGRLWLSTESGEVWSVGESDRQARRYITPEPAHDLCIQQRHVVIITGQRRDAPRWTLHQRTTKGWTILATVATQGDGLVALVCEPDRLVLVTTLRLIELAGPKMTAIALSRRVPAWGLSSTVATPAELFVGKDIGEWGGGLRRINRRTGEVTPLEKFPANDPCAGPLNTECDPVNAIAPLPWKPGCVAAAVGLPHYSSHGRVVEVCGNSIRSLYQPPCRRRSEARGCTESFFSLVQEHGALWTTAGDGLHRLHERGGEEIAAAHRYRRYGPFEVDFGSPDVVSVLVRASWKDTGYAAVARVAPR